MSSDGYTLSDALAALLMVGLAMTGLTYASLLLNRAQKASVGEAMRAADLGRGQRMLRDVLASGPASELAGDSVGFALPCVGGPCRARLEAEGQDRKLVISLAGAPERALRVSAGARLAYVGEHGVSGAWPPAGARERLRGVALVEATPSAAPLLYAPVRLDQSANCAFDAVALTCRSPQ